MAIHWTKEAQSFLTPKRGEAKPPLLRYDEKKLFADVKTVMRAEAPKFAAGAKTKDLGDPALAAPVLAFYKDFGPDSPLDPDVQGTMVAMMRGAGDDVRAIVRDLTRHWIARAGLPFTLRALHVYAQLRVVHPKKAQSVTGSDYSVSGLVADEGFSLWGLRADEMRPDVARAILAANDAAYAEVVSVIGELRKKTTSPTLRCDLASLVPTESAWAKADLAAFFEQKEDHRSFQHVRDLFPALGPSKESRKLFGGLLEHTFAIGESVYDGVRAIEEEAIAPLAKAMKKYEEDPPRANMGLAPARHIARALALFDDDAAADAFAPWIGDSKSLGPIAVEYMQAFPAQAVRLLSARLLEKTKGAEPAQHLLARIARTNASEVLAAAASLSKDQRAAVEKLAGEGGAKRESSAKGVASASDLPEVLRDPPWRRKGARPSLPIVEKLGTVKHVERIVWKDDHKAQALATALDAYRPEARSLAHIRNAIETMVAKGPNASSYTRPFIPWHVIKDDGVLDIWNETPAWARQINESTYFSEVAYMLARFDLAALSGAIASASKSMVEPAIAVIVRVDSPRVAPVVLRALGRGALHRRAVGWLSEFPVAAAIGLLPIALGPATRDKSDAATALRAHVPRARLLEVAKEMGDGVVAATEAMLAFDPMFDCPKAAPKLSSFAEPEGLPPLRLRDGRDAPEEGKRNLLEMLQFTAFDPPYAGVADARKAFDPASLDELLRVLIDGWVAAGAATASAWPLRAVAHVGSDAIARDVAAKVRKWPREKGRPRALIGVDVLGRMGTDVALMHLFDLSKRAKNRHVEARATEALAAAAEARGLSGDALEDRLVPSLDLDRDGSTSFDFGPRKVTVRVDEHLAASVFDGDQRLPSFPRAAKTDDAEKAKAAATRFKSLKGDLETLAKTQLWRLEHAMITQRKWDAVEHRALLVDHPLVGRVARKLVWAVFDGDEVTNTFRVVEDGTLASDADEAVTLGEGDRIGIPHPLVLADALKQRWSTVLGDYEIIQPFEQIARPTFAVPAAMRTKKEIVAFADREIPYGVVFGRLESRGWRRGEMEEGSTSTLEKDFGGVSATLSFSPALFVREKPPAAITIDDVSFGKALGDLPPIAYSEVMVDLSVFASKK